MEIHKIDTFGGHRDCIYTLEPSMEPNQFFSAGADGFVVQWRLDKPDLGVLLARVPASVYTLAFDQAGQYLWIGQNYEGIRLIDPDKKKEAYSVKLTSAAIFDLKLTSTLALLALSDGVVIVLDKAAVAVQKHIKASDKSARSIALHPNGQEMAVGYSDHFIRIFELETQTLQRVIPAHANSIFTVTYSPDGQYLLSGGRDAHLKVWDTTESYHLREDIVAHLFAINHIAYSPDGAFFATASMDKAVKIWDAETFRLLKVIDQARYAGHGTSVNKIWWSSYRNQLVSCSDDKRISVWEIIP